jgi:CDP-paratose 2-epimerase
MSRTSGGVLITGGAGFVGTNLADRLASGGTKVTVLDSLRRPGVGENLRWLMRKHGDSVRAVIGDVRDPEVVGRAMRGAERVFHLAAQVAVTTSLMDPLEDLEINVRGTLNVLEEARRQESPPAIVFTSTNKVYGRLEDVELRLGQERYEPVQAGLRAHGISERQPLEFCSPYGCSKGAADQYVLDYAHSFGLRACVLRMSCIYGPHQKGNEDQGWVAHFLISALRGRSITIFGDGRQARDLLFVEDLLTALLAASANERALTGRAFNIGGGAGNTASVLEVVEMVGELVGEAPRISWDAWRVADQRWYVSDMRAFGRLTGWRPRIGLDEGLARLHEWLTGVPEVRRAAVAAGS